jgi:hypothetical protein
LGEEFESLVTGQLPADHVVCGVVDNDYFSGGLGLAGKRAETALDGVIRPFCDHNDINQSA